MTERLPTQVLVSAMLRRVGEAGGFGVVLAKGEAQGGGVLVVALNRDAPARLFERGLGGDAGLIESTPTDGDTDAYWRRRRQRDPDLWVVELDVPNAQRFAAETIGAG